MPYDPCLAQRLEEMPTEPVGFEATTMFGGICWLLNGPMCVGVYKTSVIVRVGEDAAAALFREAHVRPMDITGKPLKGWAMVASEGLAEDHDLRCYLDLACEFVRGLPAKMTRVAPSANGRPFKNSVLMGRHGCRIDPTPIDY